MRIKQSTWTRPYTLNGKHLNKIFIYQDNKIVVALGYCFEIPMHENYTTSKDVLGVDITEPKRANKIDLTRNYNFYISKKDFLGETVYDLYINAKDIEVLEETEFEEEIREGEKFIYKRIKIKNNVGNFEYYKNLNDKETIETSIITMQVFDRVEKTKEFEKQQEFARAIDKKYHGGLYNFDNIKKLYNELKEFFENNKEGENEQ